MQQHVFKIGIDERRVKEISASIADEVSNRIYNEFLLVRYLPEIIAIESGKIKPLKNAAAEQHILQRIKSLAKN